MPGPRKAGMRNGWRWVVAPPWKGAVELARQLRTAPLVAQVLHNRGLDSPDEVRRFLDPKLTDLHPPQLLPDMDRAAGRLCQAVARREKICLYGDYDVDGMTGLAILYRCLAMHGAEVDYYVPHRLEEGYGVNLQAIEKIAAAGAGLLVTIDCGVTAHQALQRARQLGMEVIITDHHAPEDCLPEALAVVHPNLPGQAYPNPNLSGAGVAYKLAWQVARILCGSDRVDEPTREFLLEATSLAALGIIADVVPLTGENRVLAAYGLKGLPAVHHAGIRALLESARLTGGKLDSYDVGFCLAPRLNACGRMGHARAAVELLARADQARCRRIAASLERQNAQRQQVERQIFHQAVEMVESAGLDAPDNRALVLASGDWHAGVVGIVAARLVERFYRPTVLIALADGQGRGSGRSIDGFNMRDALAACAQHLSSFGGHAMAGGLRLPADKVKYFARTFGQYAGLNLPTGVLQPALRIDAEVPLAEISYPVVNQLARLAPFGRGNAEPVLAARSCRLLTAPQRMGRSGQTVSFIVAQENAAGSGKIRCVGFGMGDLADRLAGLARIDIAGQPVINCFNGRETVELHLNDAQPGV